MSPAFSVAVFRRNQLRHAGRRRWRGLVEQRLEHPLAALDRARAGGIAGSGEEQEYGFDGPHQGASH